MPAQAQKIEHRRHPRLHYAFPVKFQYLDETGKPQGSVFEGFTRNVARGGLSIETRLEREKVRLEFSPGKTKLKLSVSIPADSVPIDSTATVKWTTIVSEPEFDTYFFGVEYDRIDNAQQRMIARHIERLRWKPKLFFYFFLFVITFAIVFAYRILVGR